MVIRKEDLDVLEGFKDTQIIKVVTGIRRAGKSTLLEMFHKKLLQSGVKLENTIQINFEDLEFKNLDNYQKVYDYIISKLQKTGMNYIFLDEVQVIPNFQKMVDSLFIKKNCDIYITSSNAHLLSGELATLLSGRYVEIHLLPFSFKEYCSAFPNQSDFLHLYRNYLEFSSFPYTFELKNNSRLINDYLAGIFNTVLLKDIVA